MPRIFLLSTILFLLSFGVVLAYTGLPVGYRFTKNLPFGIRDASVPYLKLVLEQENCLDAKTVSGTNYYASKTFAAVKCFQNKYKTQISTFAGYTIKGTGLVGIGTRKQLNTLSLTTRAACTSFAYAPWSTCFNGIQTRTITSSIPSGCIGGGPLLSQACGSGGGGGGTVPICTDNDWTSTRTPSTCPSSGQQTKTWTKVGTCSGGVSHPSSEIVTCNYQVPIGDTITLSPHGTPSPTACQSADSTSCINNALRDYKNVHLLAGTYNFNFGGYIKLNSGNTLYGDDTLVNGQNALDGTVSKTILNLPGGSIQSKGESGGIIISNASNVIVRNLTINDNLGLGAGGIMKTGYGISIYTDGSDIHDIKISNNTVTNYPNYGILISTANYPSTSDFLINRVTIENNNINNYGSIGIEIFPRITQAKVQGGARCDTLTITGNKIYSLPADQLKTIAYGYGTGIKVTAFKNVTINNNNISGGFDTKGADTMEGLIDIVMAAQQVSIQNNVLRDAPYGIQIGELACWGENICYPAVVDVTISENTLENIPKGVSIITSSTNNPALPVGRDSSLGHGITVSENVFKNSSIYNNYFHLCGNGSDVRVKHAIIRNNTFNTTSPGAWENNDYIAGCFDSSVISNNTISTSRGRLLPYTDAMTLGGSNNQITNNTIISPYYTGMLVRCVNQGVCLNNTINNNTIRNLQTHTDYYPNTQSNHRPYLLKLQNISSSTVAGNTISSINTTYDSGLILDCASGITTSPSNNFSGNITNNISYVFSQSCEYSPPCASFTYSNWSECNSSGIQSRTVLTSSPTGCTGGDPVLSRICSLVVQYSFENNFQDSSENNINGSNYGASFISGKSGNAIQFNGDDYVDLGNNSILNLSDEITISVFVKPSTYGGYIISKSQECNNEANYNLVLTSSGKIEFSYYDGTGVNNFYVADPDISLNQWTQLVLTYNYKTYSIKIYINGQNATGSWLNDNVPNNSNPVVTTNNLTLGAQLVYYNGGSCSAYSVGQLRSFFKGSIDELKIWSRVLGSSEILGDYNSY